MEPMKNGPVWDADRTWTAVHAERARLAANLEHLSPKQWRTASLCTEWTVEETLAHLTAGASTGRLAWLRSMVSARFDAPLPVRRQRSAEEFQAAVRAAVEEIKAGEAFQVVVSQRFEVDTTADALEIYRVLRLTNPSPYMYLLRMTDVDGRPFDIVGSSPEALVTVHGPTAVTHPIAGSKPRGATPAEDAALEAELLADPKERAEHVMLVDLGRNDLGRVCEPGSVEVVEFMDVRRYSHIMHLESTVTGRIAAGQPVESAHGTGRKACATVMARTTAAALFCDSWSSVGGSESATMPPPAWT